MKSQEIVHPGRLCEGGCYNLTALRRGFPYQDRDGRLMPGDIGRQTTWWFKQGFIKAPIQDKDIVDESCLREALDGMR